MIVLEDTGIDVFFAFARERYETYLRREVQKLPAPWSEDPVLQKYRFCNLFREDDKTTKWFRENIREPLRNDAAKVLFATVAFRWFNRIETAELIKPWLLAGPEDWHPDEIRSVLKDRKPVVTGAYIIKTPNGMNKLDGVLWCIEQIRKDIDHLAANLVHTPPNERSLEGVWEVLREYPYLGDFMAYEVVTDLRHTCWLEEATDIMTWANPGPGCARGLGWVLQREMGLYNRSSKKDRYTMSLHMGDLLWAANPENTNQWRADWPRWEMREVEHWLCELAKYVRVREGGAPPKERFRS